MIVYKDHSPFGLELIVRLHGSAVARSFLPACFSTAVFSIHHYFLVKDKGMDLDDNIHYRVGEHPYVMAALIGFFAFLLIFRANFAYARYWDAATAIYAMVSRWSDVGAMAASFHMQSKRYAHAIPKSFGQYPDYHSSITRKRERQNRMTIKELALKIRHSERCTKKRAGGRYGTFLGGVLGWLTTNTRSHLRDSNRSERGEDDDEAEMTDLLKTSGSPSKSRLASLYEASTTIPEENLQDPEIRDSPLQLETKKYPTIVTSISSCAHHGGVDDKPSLFLQELSHLLSLMCAVAFSTLRNDNDLADIPLVRHVPGDAIPPANSDDYNTTHYQCLTSMQFMLGMTRGDQRRRTLYNAARPFRVIGGISDAECHLLQKSRGGHAKVALCSFWLQEFVSRESLQGSTGAIAPPIISRLYQETSNGMMHYNLARKIAEIPFPFPHAQLTSMFIFFLDVFVVPLLFLSFSNYMWFGLTMNFFTVICFTGLHEVARELENPFQNAPNDIPLQTIQAHFNEALLQFHTGFHPDAYWEINSSNPAAAVVRTMMMSGGGVPPPPRPPPPPPKGEMMIGR